MIRRPTRHDHDLSHTLQDLIGKSDLCEIDLAVFHDGIDGVLHRLRLLMDLFDHKVLKAAFFSRFGIPLYLFQFLLNLFAVQIVESDAVLRKPGHFQVADVIYLAGIFEDSRDVGSHKGSFVGHADDHRAVFSGHPYFVRTIFEHQG